MFRRLVDLAFMVMMCNLILPAGENSPAVEEITIESSPKAVVRRDGDYMVMSYHILSDDFSRVFELRIGKSRNGIQIVRAWGNHYITLGLLAPAGIGRKIKWDHSFENRLYFTTWHLFYPESPFKMAVVLNHNGRALPKTESELYAIILEEMRPGDKLEIAFCDVRDFYPDDFDRHVCEKGPDGVLYFFERDDEIRRGVDGGEYFYRKRGHLALQVRGAVVFDPMDEDGNVSHPQMGQGIVVDRPRDSLDFLK